MKRCSLIIFILCHFLLPTASAQEEDGCDLEFLAKDFRNHFNEMGNAPMGLFSSDDWLNLMWEYVTFLAICKEPQPCDTLPDTYTDALAAAQTQDDLAVISANLTADVLMCQPSNPLAPILEALGFSCNVILTDEDYVTLECEGNNSLSAAQRLYEAVDTAQGGLEQFNVTLTDVDSETRYIYTGKEWLVEQHYQP